MSKQAVSEQAVSVHAVSEQAVSEHAVSEQAVSEQARQQVWSSKGDRCRKAYMPQQQMVLGSGMKGKVSQST